MDFGKVFTRAWEIIWKHKILWVFGLFASFISEQGTSSLKGSGGGGGGTGYPYDVEDIPYLPPEYQHYFNEIVRFVQENLDTIYAVGLIIFAVILLLSVFFYLLGSLGKIGLIRGTLLAEGGAEQMTFSQIFEESKPFFWRFVGLNLIIVLVFMAAFMVLGIAALIGTAVTFGLAIFCLIPLICLFVPLFWILSIGIRQANIALVLEDLDIMSALERGYHFTREHLGNLIIAGIILFVGGAIASFIIGIPQLISVIPLIIGFFTSDFMTDPDALVRGFSATVVISLIYLPIFLALRSVLVSYIETAWTLTYLENLPIADDEGDKPPKLEEATAES